ncbi:MAG TPA: CHRD domain-containing protein [Phototrophicaceae bacterium]|jgi:hypothetical protein|nr:CHRD domain-containing protein [Phototrophicaceae bacterium]
MKKGLFLVIALLAGGIFIASLATAQVFRAPQTIEVEPLVGSSEVPGPGDGDGSGTASLTVDIDTDEVCLDVSVLTGVALPVTLAHIHEGTAGNSGSPIVSFLSVSDDDGIFNICVTDTDADAIAANPAGYYVNLHNAEFPDGAVRGQLIASNEPTATSTPTETPGTPVETPTPTATATETPSGTELVFNGSFEDELNGWTLKGAAGDKVKCNTEDKVVAYDGVCAFKFKGSTNENTKLVQILDLSSATFGVSDSMDISAYVSAKKPTTAGKLKLVILYTDADASKSVAAFFPTNGPYNIVVADRLYLASASVSKIKVLLLHASPNSKVFVDLVSLRQNADVTPTETPTPIPTETETTTPTPTNTPSGLLPVPASSFNNSGK